MRAKYTSMLQVFSVNPDHIIEIKSERERQTLMNLTCNYCKQTIPEGTTHYGNDRPVHWSCVRKIVADRLNEVEADETKPEDIDNRADEFAQRLGFKDYDAYERAAYGRKEEEN